MFLGSILPVDTIVKNLPTVNIMRVTVLNDKFNWKALTD